MKAKNITRQLKADGWVHHSTEGSHHHYKHATKPGKVTVPGNPNDAVCPKTLKRIQTQAGW
ncbi:MAG: type II toxin-antitoxin system HicA family toxin [Agitococcus sp.]|nr:type II toxin-antitoxin system HicA family toxin [Agitococcus sp.]